MFRAFMPLGSIALDYKIRPTPTKTVPHQVITDLDVFYPSHARKPDFGRWQRINKDLYLHKSGHTAWLHIEVANAQELAHGTLVVTDLRVGKEPSEPGSSHPWESRNCGLWLKREQFSGDTKGVATEVDVLFGEDAVEPRPQWALIQSPLQLNNQSNIPVAKISILFGRVHRKLENSVLRVRDNGKFKIVQISDTHMVTGVGKCQDAIDALGKDLPESEADPLTVSFIAKILDIERPDLVVLTGDQLHHDIPDSQTAIFKVVAPLIDREIPYAWIFGNHDSEGKHALSRMEQMSILESLPFSLCEPGPKQVDGIGNFVLPILAPAPLSLTLSTLYFLDSHGQIPSWFHNPDYDPIKQSQIEWFLKTAQAQRSVFEKDGIANHPHLSMAFIHIPLPELKDDSRLTLYGGERREPTECPRVNSHFYDALVQARVSALAFGHDHVNDFCALRSEEGRHTGQSCSRRGPWLCYGGGSGFGGYCSYGSKRYYRQMRVWEMDTNEAALRTWKRREYIEGRVDELVLVENGVVVEPFERAHANKGCVLS